MVLRSAQDLNPCLDEIVFARYFAPQEAVGGIYGPSLLNSEISHGEGAKFEQGRFCYLKFHGTVGVEPYGVNEPPRFFGQYFGQYAPFPIKSSLAQIADQTYFGDEVDGDGLPHSKRVPLLVFPAEKQRVEADGAEYNLEAYVHAIRAAAKETFKQAKQIRIVGYSFAAPLTRSD